MKKLLSSLNLTAFNLTTLTLISIFISQPVMAAGKIKCWRNNEGTRECGTYVPPEYSQKRTEERDQSGRVINVEKRAKTEAELAEIARQEELKKIEDARRAEQKKKDDILLKTFSTERDINMLRDSKINVIEGILTVTNSNNKALMKKLEIMQKQAANAERRGQKAPENIVSDIKAIEERLKNNMASIKEKRNEQQDICNTFAKDLQHFRQLKGQSAKPQKGKAENEANPTTASKICNTSEDDKVTEDNKPATTVKK
ncbi:MAG: hypothetical protein OQK75_00710 [Gammaproteobacteria bacterium]|nr:hypothetical protein [Gammaproteobacteria bacterium]